MIVISFLLDGICSKYLLVPLFTLVSIVYKSFLEKEDKILKFSIIVGILYDIVYTDTLIINGLIFYFISYNIYSYQKKYKINFLKIFIIELLSIIFYLILNYMISKIYGVKVFDLIYSIKIILIAVITNMIYFLIIYYLSNKKRF